MLGDVLALEDLLAAVVEFQLGDHDVGRVDGDGDGCAVGLVAGDLLDVDDELASAARGDLALFALDSLAALQDLDLVVLADRESVDLRVEYRNE